MVEKIGLIAIFDTKQFNRGLNDYLGGVNEANDATKQGEKNSFSFARALEVTVGNALLQVANLAVDAAKAMIGFGVDSIGVAAEFQSSLAVLQTAASDTGLSMDELGNIAIAVGADSRILGASASGAADAMTGLFKSGLDAGAVFGDLNAFMDEGAELGGALRASFDLAAATTLDVAQAADLGAVVLSTFGSELETSAEKSDFINMALDNMVKAADASVAEVEDLASALKFVGPAAFSAGMSIEDTNNALAILSTRGITGSMAGTGLRQMLASLQSPTDKAQGALKSLGVELRDQEGNMLPLVDIIGNFSGALDGMSAAQQDAALNAIFTVNGLAALRPLLAEGEEGWNAMAEATANAAGMQEQAAIKSQTYAGQMEALEGQIETLQIQFGSALLPALTGFIEAIIPIIEQHGPMLEQIFSTMGDALLGLVDGFFALFGANVQGGIAEIGEVIGMVFGEEAQQTFIQLAAWLQETIPQAVQFLSDLWINVLQPSISSVWAFINDSLIPIFILVVAWLQENIPPAIEFLSDLWNNTLLPALTAVWSFINDSIIPVYTAMVDTIESAVVPILEVLAETWETVLQPALEIVWGYINDSVIPLLTTLGELISATLTVALEALAGIWQNVLQPAVESAMQTFEDKVKPILDDVATNVLPKLENSLNKIGDAVSNVTGFFQGLIDKVKSIEIPEWMQPGSPPPLFFALNDISNALRVANKEFDNMRVELADMNINSSIQNGTLGTDLVSPISQTTTSSSTINNNDNREINIDISNQGSSNDRVFFDVVGALGAVGIA